MKICSVYDAEFARYGRVHSGIESAALLREMEKIPLPESGTAYEPSIAALEACEAFADYRTSVFGGMPVQLGMCWGRNTKLNCLEYHRDSEINIAVTDLILILGKEQDITEDHTYDSSKMEAFLIPAGTTIEVYATTLHYAPCNVAASGFKCVVVLPKGTNTDITLEEKHTPEDDLLFARNKWLLSHPDANIAGSVAGIKGENLSVK